ncbi:hypothetical protein B7P43_G11885 [Cryptotermes secundus]|uniref:Uncharacterized protein n=1 Tax=Cryptotermes secundus TaxID=105785 RepID=A0A2J7Q6V5_9NEOP|nr:hypothetical protein B7P43_G11885 [Cryptotermes secundus]
MYTGRKATEFMSHSNKYSGSPASLRNLLAPVSWKVQFLVISCLLIGLEPDEQPLS